MVTTDPTAPIRRRPRAALAAAALLLAAAALPAGGCRVVQRHMSPSGTPLAVTAFDGDAADAGDGPEVPAGVEAPAVAAGPLATDEPDVPPVTPPEPAPGPTLADGGAGPEPLPVLGRPGERVIVDSLVGQVSGRPIFAEAFFRPIDDELRAERRRLPPEDFQRLLDQRIARRLRDVVLNELILAEAEAGLTPEFQQGLFHLMQQWRNTLISENRGVASIAERELSAEGETLDSVIEGRRDELLIAQQLREEVMVRARFAWRDVEREYHRRAEEFNQPGAIRGYRFRLPARDAERVAESRRLLDQGVPFLEIAEAMGFGEAALLFEFELDAEGLPAIRPGPFRDALEGLEPGDTAEPFERAGRVVFIHVTERVAPVRRSLYDADVQRRLVAIVRARRQAEAENRYVASLLEHGIYDEIEEMARRLRAIAVARYAS